MKVCVFGAGAIGGYLAARLLETTAHEVSVVVRGEQLLAIRARGLRLITPTEDFVVQPHAATDSAQSLPPQDLVLVTLKAHSQAAAAADIAHLLSGGGSAVFVNNGIPWWWAHTGAEPCEQSLPLLDHQGALGKQVQAQRVIGCVAYSANAVVEPGVVHHTANNRWILGEPNGQHSARLSQAVTLLQQAGLNTEVSDNIRHSVWNKLLRNAAMNSLCALTRLSVEQLAGVPGILDLYNALVDEIAAIAAAQGHDLLKEVNTAKQVPLLGAAIDGTRGARIKPSMLQDIEAGRAIEVEAIVGQVQAFARACAVATPTLDAITPLLRALDLAQRKLV
jgi:2-dehydropantoate 2-reductase